MIKEGEELADLHEQIVVKLPMTKKEYGWTTFQIED
jgi:transaldolase